MAEWSRIHGDSLTAPRMNRDSVTSLGSGRANYNGVVPLIERIERAHAAIVYGLLAVLLAAVFVPMSLLRLVDGDEGTYLLVSRLVVEGQVPYHDFFYPQMFLLPYVYGAWMKLVSYSWYGARVLSAVFSIALGLLVCRQAARLAGARRWGVLAVVLFTFSSLAFGWYPLVKTFVLPTLFLFAAYAVLSSASRWRWVASGVLIGLALALLPNELFFLIEPRTFLFNIVGNQVIRSDFGLLGWVEQRVGVVEQLLAINRADGVTSFQFLLLFLLNLTSWVSSALLREQPSLVSTIVLSLLLISLAPTPVYTQYFCIPIPFLVVNAVVFLARLDRDALGPRLRHLFASIAAVYVLVSPFDLYRYSYGGALVPGITGAANVVDWRIPTIRAVARAIDHNLRRDRQLAISFWPGYFVETRASLLPGLENHFALIFSRKVSPHEVTQFKLMSYPELARHLRQRTVDVIVLGNWTDWTHNRESIRSQIVQNGYVMKERIANTEIYTPALDGHQ